MPVKKSVVEKRAEKKTPESVGKLLENKVIVEKSFSQLEEKSYGKRDGTRLELAYTEALYLLEKGRLGVKKGAKGLAFSQLMEHAHQNDRRIKEKYVAYKDLRDRGF